MKCNDSGDSVKKYVKYDQISVETVRNQSSKAELAVATVKINDYNSRTEYEART